MKWLLRVFAFPLLLCVIAGVSYVTAIILHDMKPSLLDYQKSVLATGEARKIYLVNLGWHTDIVVKLEDVSLTALPEKNYFKDSEYLAIGWGDAAFYPAKELPPKFILQTLFSPTETVVHIAGFLGTPRETFAYTDVLEFYISKNGFDKMMQSISGSINRGTSTAAKPLRDGQYGVSHFFAGNGSYHALHNCNHWTAEKLAVADIPFNEKLAVNAYNVMWQASKYGSDE